MGIRNQIKNTLMVSMTFCLLVFDGGGGLKTPAHAGEKGLDFIEEYIATLDPESGSNIFFIEDQNSAHLKSMREILFALSFGDKVLLDPEVGKKVHFLKSSQKILFPDIEFVKINPTKYRLRVHRAKKNFPLVFNEIFHNGWTVYLKPWTPRPGSEKEPDKNPRATLSVISAPTAFRNNNLPPGDIWETWFPGKLKANCPEDKDKACLKGDPEIWNVDGALGSSVVRWPEAFHWQANGYANSWWLDLDLLKKLPAVKDQKPGWYHLHSDGSVDFEIVLEFWPQRLFYLGILISGITVTACVGYLIFGWVSSLAQRKRKNA
jgi:hypothetical protein